MIFNICAPGKALLASLNAFLGDIDHDKILTQVFEVLRPSAIATGDL
jgi:hypothetical protein